MLLPWVTSVLYTRNAAAVPAAPKIKLTTSGNQFQLSWNAVSGATSYQVYRIVDSTVEDYTLLGTTKSTTFTDKAAKTGTTYTFAVKAVNANGESMTSSPCAGKLTTTTPDNVTLSSAKAVNGGIQVTWKAADGAVKYRVYRKGPGDANWVIVATVTGTSYTDKTAKAGVKYTYTVRGIASDGKTLSPGFDATGVSATMPKPVTAPANVTLTGAKVVNGGIQVTWQKAAGAEKYRVYRIGPGDANWVIVATVTGTSYTDKTAKAGVTYTYTVRGIAADGKTLSPGYNRIGISAVIAPAKVVLVSAKADSAGILVTWQKAAGAHSYQVFRKTAGTNWKCIAKNIHDTEWKDIDAVKGTKYFYTVRAVADDGTTRGGYDKTGKTAAVTKDPTTPANVTLGKAGAGKNGITVTWSYAVDARTYRVYRKAAGETKWTIVAKNAEGKNWTDKNVTKGVKYTYTVRGVNANGKLSPGYNKTGVSTVAK